VAGGIQLFLLLLQLKYSIGGLSGKASGTISGNRFQVQENGSGKGHE